MRGRELPGQRGLMGPNPSYGALGKPLSLSTLGPPWPCPALCSPSVRCSPDSQPGMEGAAGVLGFPSCPPELPLPRPSSKPTPPTAGRCMLETHTHTHTNSLSLSLFLFLLFAANCLLGDAGGCASGKAQLAPL